MTTHRWLFALLFLFIAVQYVQSDQITTVRGLISRILGDKHVNNFQLELLPPTPEKHDVFEIGQRHNHSSPVVIRGTSGVALSSGIYWYLKYYCKAIVTWGVNGTGNQLQVPEHLELVPTQMRMKSVRWRYYMNTCTLSYSTVWWDWARWEQEIDWMALHGINLPLAFTGQEYIWNKLFTAMGFTETELGEFLGGPAFLAWSRMGNIRGWGGPIPYDWMEKQYQLQTKILERERAFGMTPVLPGFAGFVPKSFTKRFPNASVVASTQWVDFPPKYCCTDLLDPSDSMFSEIGGNFIRLLMTYYGTDHIYSADTFNEMTPSSNNVTYLKATSASVYNSMKSVDPDAIWLMQGWLFLEGYFWNNVTIPAYLSGVPDDKMLILDLYAEVRPVWVVTDNFYGKPYIWCMLHNFGGNRGVYGDLANLASAPLDAKHSHGSTMIGTGLTMEAIESNPIMYELMTEMAWREEKTNVQHWVQDYVTQRYGLKSKPNSDVSSAWKLLLDSVYSDNDISQSPLQYRPSLDWSTSTSPNTTMLTEAGRLILRGYFQVEKKTGPFHYDLVDIVRQILSNIYYDAYMLYVDVLGSYGNNLERIDAYSTFMLSIIDETENLLRTNPNFLLGKWIADASAQATSDEEIHLMMFNARNQIAGWGPTSNINDYAAKQWSGLVGDYYRSRWSFFFEVMRDVIARNGQLNVTKYNEDALVMEQEFSGNRKKYPVDAQGNVQEIAKRIESKFYTMPDGYVAIPEMDFEGNDINSQATWTKDVATMGVLCDVDPSCVGFNSYGFLKMTLSGKKPDSACTFYLKQSTH